MNTFYDISTSTSVVVDKHGVVIAISTHLPETKTGAIDRPLATIARITGTNVMLFDGVSHPIAPGVVALPTMAWRA